MQDRERTMGHKKTPKDSSANGRLYRTELVPQQINYKEEKWKKKKKDGGET